ncbi:hypothetical protein [Stigmatella erecta]|uniref:hypothetical protein n=1 Tax=Stigmatella erecta TaxID=83460 RepID=UPI003183B1FF
MWSSGANSTGQLGDGTTSDRAVPVAVQGVSGLVAVAAGYYHSLMVRSDGTLWGWGSNAYGQIGDGGPTDYAYTPVLFSY